MAEQIKHTDERLGVKVVAVTAVILLVFFGLYWSGRTLLLAPTDREEPEKGITVPLKKCTETAPYHNLEAALAAEAPCTLDLSNQQLAELPGTIGQLTSLRTLNLSNNQ